MKNADGQPHAMDPEQQGGLHGIPSNSSNASGSHGSEEAASQPPSYKESMTRKMLAVWNASLAWVGSKSVLEPVAR